MNEQIPNINETHDEEKEMTTVEKMIDKMSIPDRIKKSVSIALAGIAGLALVEGANVDTAHSAELETNDTTLEMKLPEKMRNVIEKIKDDIANDKSEFFENIGKEIGVDKKTNCFGFTICFGL